MRQHLREYFIGQYLREETDPLKQASVRLLYNMVSISIVSLVTISFIYLSKGLHYQLIKNLVIMSLFIGGLF